MVACERAWAEAFVTGDYDPLQALLAPEFKLVGVRSTGASDIPRAQWFAMLPSMRFLRFEQEVTAVDLFGDTALATVEGYWRVDWGERVIDENFFLTDVWVRPAGRWQVVRRHSSPYKAG